MAIDMTFSGSGTRVPNYIKADTYQFELDFAKALEAKGSALAVDDVFEVFNVPAGCVVEYACLTTVTAADPATVVTLDLGDGTGTARYVDGFDATATTAGVPVMTVQKYYPAADTVDVLLQALTGVLSTGKVKVSIRVFELTI